ncbi:MAG TPA: hypothetical protein PLN52_17290, partial [Opitutaceae bacterium]|nr:hypothetical protein [Opitutaceae bacterium]
MCQPFSEAVASIEAMERRATRRSCGLQAEWRQVVLMVFDRHLHLPMISTETTPQKIVVTGMSFYVLVVAAFTFALHGTVYAEPATIMTVRGPISASELGLTLSHEHIMSIFGAEPTPTPSYDESAVLPTVVPTLNTLRELGLRAVVDGTAQYFGREPLLLRKIAEASDVHLITNTGYYGAAKGRYLPPDLDVLTAEQVSERWIAEWKNGIGDTGIRPGFIKLGV